jgi:hypothetical protein
MCILPQCYSRENCLKCENVCVHPTTVSTYFTKKTKSLHMRPKGTFQDATRPWLSGFLNLYIFVLVILKLFLSTHNVEYI